MKNDNRDIIRAARLRRRYAHAASAATRALKHNPANQRLQHFASVEARIANIAHAMVLGREISSIETPPLSFEKQIQYYNRLRKLHDHARLLADSFQERP